MSYDNAYSRGVEGSMYALGLQLLKPGMVVGMLLASVVLPALPVWAPELQRQLVPLSKTDTLADLYHRRDRLRAELRQRPAVTMANRSGLGVVSDDALDQLWSIDHRLRQEEQAQKWRHQAQMHAAAARGLGDPAFLPTSMLDLVVTHWEAALLALDQIPGDTFGAMQVVVQQRQYEGERAIAAYHHDTARSDFLRAIADQKGLAGRLRLTICNLQRECRRWQGNQPPASPASLIKVPVAIALMAKLHQEGTAPATPLWVSPSNWTEDAGSTWVRTEYPLEQVMADMVSASGNIATNQLIDYLGWEGVNQILRSRGYTTTRVTSKLVGESTYPANAGNAPNVITTDELTDMMVAIYNHEYPGAELIETALANQRDRALGHAAVQAPITWLGEKTGRNSKVLGTTTAISVGGQRYIITATLDHSGSESALRSVVADVVQYLLTHNGFEHTVASSEAIAARPQAFLP
ncbi:serine hydrolase [Nodosilinea sp. LEGE 07088]|uniref:serine hydrolase n=1 Tax=Nodosilinea sp. LEGE 07088 TaxID=2777968 RepID=UPI00187FDCC8|nr:serine hydrolase [Nodosilinea sp. LEGE 07088]MBE9136902.1 serine hydrolase [Nodosilinea sp. LEGE 07088]